MNLVQAFSPVLLGFCLVRIESHSLSGSLWEPVNRHQNRHQNSLQVSVRPPYAAALGRWPVGKSNDLALPQELSRSVLAQGSGQEDSVFAGLPGPVRSGRESILEQKPGGRLVDLLSRDVKPVAKPAKSNFEGVIPSAEKGGGAPPASTHPPEKGAPPGHRFVKLTVEPSPTSAR